MKPMFIATDSELFVKDGAQYIPGCGLIGGSKKNPILVPHGNLQEDNVLAEFAIDKVAIGESGLSEFQYNIHSVMDSLRKTLSPLTLDLISSYYMDMNVLEYAGAPAFQFSCDPDYNAWTGKRNPIIDYEGNLRVAGGHIHLSWDGLVSMEKFIKACDIFLGIPSVVMDGDTDRRTLYGKAGSFRPKQYDSGHEGAEYRVLSNFWLKDDDHIAWAYKNTLKAFHESNTIDDYIEEVGASTIIRCINTGDRKTALNLIDHFELDVL